MGNSSFEIQYNIDANAPFSTGIIYCYINRNKTYKIYNLIMSNKKIIVRIFGSLNMYFMLLFNVEAAKLLAIMIALRRTPRALGYIYIYALLM